MTETVLINGVKCKESAMPQHQGKIMWMPADEWRLSPYTKAEFEAAKHVDEKRKKKTPTDREQKKHDVQHQKILAEDILIYLGGCKESKTIKQIAQKLSAKEDTCRKSIRKLEDQRRIIQSGFVMTDDSKSPAKKYSLNLAYTEAA